MWIKGSSIVGALAGWGVAITLTVTGALPHERAVPVMLLSLSVALLCTAMLAMQRHQRPLGAAFELGYDMGRRDAIREATRRSNVSPIRRAQGGLSEFNRQKVGV